MLHKSLPIFFLLVCGSVFGQNTDYINYVNKFKDIAIREMDRAGVPASIKLAQGLLESGGGTSTLARKANNHFGIKCGSKWTGRTHYRKDDDRDPKTGKLIKSCFRSYRNAEASYVAHSEFLRSNRRYDFLFYLNPRDYKRWAYGLKKAGYATSATYAEKLIKVIETYDLSQFDNYTPTDVLAGTVTSPGGTPSGGLTGVLLNNDVKMVLAKAGQTPIQISRMTQVSVKRIIKYNEKIISADQTLSKDERVYLQKKRRSYRERKKYHYVKEGESMYRIAQQYGVRLKRLYRRNRMSLNSQPATGERIKLRGWKVKPTAIPRLRNEVPPRKPSGTTLPDEDNDGYIDMEDEDGKPISSPKPSKPESKPETTSEPEKPKRDSLPAVTGTGFDNNNSNTSDEEVFIPPTVERPDNSNSEETVEQFYIVQQGDTLYSISRRFSLSVAELKNLNGLSGNLIRRGQKLKVQ